MTVLLQPVADALVTARSDGRTPPSAAIMAVAEADEIFTAASGIANLDTAEPATTAHGQDSASVGKTLTTLAAQVLFSRGILHADDTLGRVLGAKAGVHADVTVDDLLRHRGGLKAWWPLYLMPDVREDPFAVVLALDPDRARDSARVYSDLGMQLVGGVIAAATGMPFDDALRTLVLDPLRAHTVTASAPTPGQRVLAGQDGDAVEEDMVRSGVPYEVNVDADSFAWRRGTITDQIGDGNAFHAYGGVTGHAGWFSDVGGLLRIAGALADPARLGIKESTARELMTERDPGQARGVRTYRLSWRGRPRLFIGHPGFTGAFIAASPAIDGDPAVCVAVLMNRLHARPAPERKRLIPTEQTCLEAIAEAGNILHPMTGASR